MSRARRVRSANRSSKRTPIAASICRTRSRYSAQKTKTPETAHTARNRFAWYQARRDAEAQGGAFVVPGTVVIAGDHPEPVIARAEVVVQRYGPGAAACSGTGDPDRPPAVRRC